MKKTAILLVSFAILLIVFVAASIAASAGESNESVSILMDGKKLDTDVNPQIQNGRVLVPVRSITEALGATVTWDGATRVVTIAKATTTVTLKIGNQEALLNGNPFTLDVPSVIVQNRTLVPLRFISEAMGADVDWDAKTRTVTVTSQGNDQTANLPVIGSYENLKSILTKMDLYGQRTTLQDSKTHYAPSVAESSAPSASPAAADGSTSGSKDYSTTNVQVQGVDEADVVKTDGEYIYQVNKQRIIIAKAYPAENMKIISTLTFENGKETQFAPQELYVDDKHLVVIGSNFPNFQPYPMPGPAGAETSGKAMPEIMPTFPVEQTLMAKIYDITDKTNIRLTREAELEGTYVTSRKIGSSLYLIANKYANVYRILEEKAEIPAPAYRDSAEEGSKLQPLDYDEIRYFPDSPQPNYLLIAGLNLEEPGNKIQVSAYLGAGENVYASSQNLYVTQTRHETEMEIVDDGANRELVRMPVKTNTAVYKFALENGQAKYAGNGEVPGTILNQFSMDEHNGYFRVATTKGNMWEAGENTSKNNMYVLNEDLKLVGKVEDIAPGERIYSTRFMGDRAYMVTFRSVDPLFVIDLKNPADPKILGYLKIPGYSDYLRPYDENHVIGFGKDTVEVPQKDWQGKDTGTTMAFYQGMKVALFDVSDVSHPVEKFVEKIGDRGTESELLQNHKALLFSREKNLLAFPVTVMEIAEGTGASGVSDAPAAIGSFEESSAGAGSSDSVQSGVGSIATPDTMANATQYGRFAFQGAYVYHIDLQQGFKLRGKITHLSPEEMSKAGDYWYDSEKNVERILYIEDTLYTLSKAIFKAHDLRDMREIGSLLIP